MGLFDKIKKAFKTDEYEEEILNKSTEPIKKDNYQKNEYNTHKSQKGTNENIESNEHKTLTKNFTYLDQLIHSGQKEIKLEHDIILENEEKKQYKKGILIDIDNILINGNGHTIDAKRQTRIFQTIGKNITIKNITLQNGYSNESGGAIGNAGFINIIDSILTNNLTKLDGGVIYNDTNGKINIINTEIKNNTSKTDGGAIFNWGEIKIKNSIFQENASNQDAGAIHNGGFKHNTSILKNNTINEKNIDLNNVKITIEKTFFLKNTSKDSGGSILNWGILKVKNSTLNNNTAKKGNGGAIWNTKGTMTILDSTLNNNTAKNGGAIDDNGGLINITDTTLTQNTAKENGGAINNEGTIIIQNSTLNNNTAKKGNGGALNNEKSMKIFHCEFCNNKNLENIIESGGYTNSILEIYNTQFKENNSNQLIVNHSILFISKCKLMYNNVKKAIIYNGKTCNIENTLFDNKIQKDSKNIINETDLTLKNLKIKDDGKSILNNGRVLIKKSSEDFESKIEGEGIIENNTITISTEEKFDFGYLDKEIHESSSKEIILDTDICFENYEIDFYEGGIELDVDDLVIDGNGHTIDGSDKSRIFIITANNITLKNIIFKNGYTAKNYYFNRNNPGGAIKSNHNTNLTIENCEFIFNLAEHGGAVHNNGTITLKDTILEHNRAKEKGGAITNCGQLTITDSTLQDNTATFGGAIRNHAKLTLINTTLQENTANHGGAVTNTGTITIHNTTLKNNTASWCGGAIFNHKGKLTIQNTTLTNNVAKGFLLGLLGFGGAIWSDKKNIQLEKCEIYNNKHDNIHISINKKNKIFSHLHERLEFNI